MKMYNTNEMNILISMSGHIGDFIWATSAIALLKKTYPHSKITIIASTMVKDLIDNNPVIDVAIYIPYYSGVISKIKRFLCIIMNIIKLFSKKKFDIVFMLDSSKASLFMSKMMRIPKIVGGDCLFWDENKTDPISKYYTDKIILRGSDNHIHVAVRFQNIVKSFFNIYNNALPVLPDSKKYSQKVKNIIRNMSDVNIALCIQGSVNSPKVWSIENFKKVISNINDKYNSKNISFYLVGTENNVEYSQNAIVNDNVYNICGKTSLLELKEFLNKCNLLISLDTGTVHIAAAAKTNIIALYGAAFFASCMPMFHKTFLLFKETHCSPCFKVNKSDCPTYPFPECMQRITPEEVTKAAIKMLETKSIK
jgi:ADP-heptose:LPS heptosyltransferase